MSESPEAVACPVCGVATRPAGTVRGTHIPADYLLRTCDGCGHTHVVDPPAPDLVYTPAYYRGEGADPLVDLEYETRHPDRTIRIHEWEGIARRVGALVPVTPRTRWLDAGCGTGGLVRHLRATVGCDAVGLEEGWAVDALREQGIPIIEPGEVDAAAGTFDVVTAIEVVEHIPDPLPFLHAMRRLLRPGGLLFLTTGNAEPHRDHLERWSYVIPEIHVSLFEPRTLEAAMARTGFRPQRVGYGPGTTDIIRFKVLKNLGRREPPVWDRLVPWGLAARVIDRRYGVSAHPVGWAV